MRARIFICLFLIPVAVYAVSFTMESVFNRRLREPILRMHPEATEQELAGVTVRALCAKRIPQLRLVCATYRNLRLIRLVGVVAVLFGIIPVILGFIAPRGRAEARQKLADLLEITRLPITAAYAVLNFALASACLTCISNVFLNGPNKAFLGATLTLSAALVALMSRSIFLGIKKAASILKNGPDNPSS